MQAMSERESAVRAAQLSYTDAPIHVEVVQASDLQKAPAAPTGKSHSPAVADPHEGLCITGAGCYMLCCT